MKIDDTTSTAEAAPDQIGGPIPPEEAQVLADVLLGQLQPGNPGIFAALQRIKEGVISGTAAQNAIQRLSSYLEIPLSETPLEA